MVIDEAKKLILSKNEGQLLQDFIWEAQKIGTGEALVQPDVPVSKESAQQDADRAVEGLKTLGTLLITNGEFRKLCKCIPLELSAESSSVLTLHSERCYDHRS